MQKHNASNLPRGARIIHDNTVRGIERDRKTHVKKIHVTHTHTKYEKLSVENIILIEKNGNIEWLRYTNTNEWRNVRTHAKPKINCMHIFIWYRQFFLYTFCFEEITHFRCLFFRFILYLFLSFSHLRIRFHSFIHSSDVNVCVCYVHVTPSHMAIFSPYELVIVCWRSFSNV